MQRNNSTWQHSYRRFVSIACMVSLLLGVVFAQMCFVHDAYADEEQQTESTQQNTDTANTTEEQLTEDNSVVVNDHIIDSQNLLGGNVDRVNDAIARVYDRTQVTVQLMYIPYFSNKTKPEQWAERYIKSKKPAKNTVFMAVASVDGNVVVVVSQGSDSWLSNQQTVNTLTEAALEPLNQKNPDWAGAAIALSNAIIDQRYPSAWQWIQRHSALVISMSILIVVACVGLVYWRIVARRKRNIRRQLERRARKSHKRQHGHIPEDTSEQYREDEHTMEQFKDKVNVDTTGAE